MIYVTSDLHGYNIEMFKKHLSAIGFNEQDWLYILGDVIDFGEDGVKYLQWLLVQGNVQLILGNHEAMLLACSFIFSDEKDIAAKLNEKQKKQLEVWMKNGAQPTIKALRKLRETNADDFQAIMEYLRDDCPLCETVPVNDDDFILTHSGLGGFSPDKKLRDYKKTELLWNKPSLDDNYFDDITVIFGHTPTFNYGSEYDGRALRTDTWIDIDAGCANGRKPVILRLDDMQEFRF